MQQPESNKRIKDMSMIAKKCLVGFFMMYSTVQCFAQEPFDQKLAPQNPVVSSPEASSITRVVDNSVDYKTGIPDVTIPLFDLTTGDITVPIRIRHAGSGIKVRELASPVGLGWSLDAGGVISSIVNGGLGGLTFNNEQEVLDYFNANSHEFIYNSDHQPDVFLYSFLDKSGKFIFGNDGTGYGVPVNNLQISRLSQAVVTIKDAFGFAYEFDEVERQSTSSTCPGGDLWAPGEVGNTSFYLSTIKSPSNRKVDFFYKTYSYSYYTDVSQSKSFMEGAVSTSLPSPSNCWTKNIIHEGKVIEEIVADNGYRVKFFYGESRNDLPIGNNLGRLEQVVVYFQDKILKSFTLTHSFVNCTTPVKFSVPSDFYSKKHDGNTRMFLAQIQESGSEPYSFTYNLTYKPGRFSYGVDHWGYYNGKDNNENLIPFGTDYLIGCDREASESQSKAFSLQTVTYPTKGIRTFVYEGNKAKITSAEHANTNFLFKSSMVSCTQTNSISEVVTIPSIASSTMLRLIYWTNSPRTQDLVQEEGQPFSRTTLSWNENGTQQTLVLNGYGDKDSYQGFTVVPGRSYTVNIETAGMVDQVPVSTHVRFVWMEEIFQSLNVSETNILCGGLRIKSIQSVPHVGAEVSSVEYTYPATLDGIKLQYPTYWYYTYHRFNELSNPAERYRRSSSSINPLPTVVYDMVSVYQVSQGQALGKTEYYYSNKLDRMHYVLGTSLYAETDDSWTSGDIVKTKHYKTLSNGLYELVQETDFVYEIGADISAFYATSFKPSEFHLYGIKGAIKVPAYITAQPQIEIPPIYIFEVYKHWGGFKYLKEKSVKDYSGQAVTTTTHKYVFDLMNRSLKKEILYGDKTTLIEYKRVSDVVAQPGSVVRSMQLAGITEPIIEARRFEVKAINKLLSGFFIQYGLIGPISNSYFYKPIATHSMVLTQPLDVPFHYQDESSFTDENGVESLYQNYYELESTYTYDNDLNVTQVTDRTGISKAFLYDGFNQVIATCDNAAASEIFFTNFEESGSQTCPGVLQPKSGAMVFCGGSFTISSTYQPQNVGQLEMSYWYFMNNEWIYSGTLPYSRTITAPVGTSALDDIRVYPKFSVFSSFSYDYGRGINSKADANATYQFFRYDQFGRLRFVVDKDGYILQANEIHYRSN